MDGATLTWAPSRAGWRKFNRAAGMPVAWNRLLRAGTPVCEAMEHSVRVM